QHNMEKIGHFGSVIGLHTVSPWGSGSWAAKWQIWRDFDLSLGRRAEHILNPRYPGNRGGENLGSQAPILRTQFLDISSGVRICSHPIYDLQQRGLRCYGRPG